MIERNNLNQTQKAEGQTNWLKSLLIRTPRLWSSRLALAAARLRQMKIGQQRRLRRLAAAGAASVAGLALVAVLAGPMAPPVHAATITVDGVDCTLIDAIKAANTENVVPGSSCAAGSGADTIVLDADVLLDSRLGGNIKYYGSYVGLPLITSPIIIESSGGSPFEIARDPDADDFRIFTVAQGGDLTLRNVTVLYGSAKEEDDDGKGGAVYATSSTLTLDGTTIAANRAYDEGGGIFAITSTVSISNSYIANNQTLQLDGGGIYAQGGSLTIVDSTISGNFAQNAGGGIWFEGTTLSIDSTDIISNTSLKNGGGVQARGLLSIIDSDFVGNSSIEARGGGLSISRGDSGSVVSATEFISNTAFTYGGGIRVSEGSVTLSDITVISNTATTESGGGIYIETGTVILNDSIITGNEAGAEGGGIYIEDETVLVAMTNITVTNNTATEEGGGIYINNGTVSLDSSTISGNEAGLKGGGIYVDDGTTAITSTLVTSNTTGFFGGGVYIKDANVSIITSTISANTAAQDGGGVHIDSSASFTNIIQDSTISGNSAGDKGGGIYVKAGPITLVNSTVSNNTATQYGGGFYVQESADSALDLTHVTASGNRADANGGGVFAAGGTVTINASILSGNTAGDLGYEIFHQKYPSTVTLSYSVLGDDSINRFTAYEGFINYDHTVIIATLLTDEATPLADILDPALADNGGLGTLPGDKNTYTHILPSGSPAIDIITGGSCDVPTDQRGIDRPQGAGCDAGAVELEATLSVCPADTGSLERTSILGGGMNPSGAATVVIPGGDPVVGLYAQLAGSKLPKTTYTTARFIPRRNSTNLATINDTTVDSKEFRDYAVFWYGQTLDAHVGNKQANKNANRVYAQLLARPTAGKKMAEALLLYVDRQASEEYFNYVSVDQADAAARLAISRRNMVYWGSGWVSRQTYTVDFPEALSDGRTVAVEAAVVGNDSDNRAVKLTVLVYEGSTVVATKSFSPTKPSNGRNLNLIKTTLNAPVGADRVVVRLESPNRTGDSAALVGVVANFACEEPN